MRKRNCVKEFLFVTIFAAIFLASRVASAEDTRRDQGKGTCLFQT